MIDIRKLKELVRLMVSNDLTELDLRDTEEQVTLRRPSTNAAPHLTSATAAPLQHAPHAANHHASASPPHHGAAPEAADDSGLISIESPMVGTFYAKANPDAEPFVSAGARISPDTVVCLLEAMKIFNEIKAECSGTVHRVMVNSGDPVEFGDPLFQVRPD